MSDFSAQASTPISRRTFAKGAAWAAPIVAIAIAAPAAAATGTGVATLSVIRGSSDVQVNIGWQSGTIPSGTEFTIALTYVPNRPTWSLGTSSNVSSYTYALAGTASQRVLTLKVTTSVDITSSTTTAFARFNPNPASPFTSIWTATVLPPTVAASPDSGMYNP